MSEKADFVTKVTCEKAKKQVRIGETLANEIDKHCEENDLDKKTYTTKLLAEAFWEDTRGQSND